ncbi:hypothetical protein [Carnimonas nigrificans]|uniref:hypothetical protein n=1 Tax=Carnimonas nigrificans TaxID=64323 RepID=UPI00046E86E9|nr:hypothetical protein [Carnimonas nigrificans]
MTIALDTIAQRIAGWFNESQLVGLGEAHHTPVVMRTLGSLITEGALGAQCRDLVVEFGAQRHQSLVDDYLAGAPLGAAQLAPLWRQSAHGTLWAHPVYAALLRRLRAYNLSRPAHQRFRVWLAEPDGCTGDKPAPLARSAAFAELIQRQLLDQGRRALLLFGMRHLALSPINQRPSLAWQLRQEGATLRTLWPELPPRCAPFHSSATRLRLIDFSAARYASVAHTHVAPWGGTAQPLGQLCSGLLRIPGAHRPLRTH